MYQYINIASDTEYTGLLSVNHITSVVKAFPDCIEDDRHWFKNRADRPWFRINLRRCDRFGNYPAGLPQDGDMANMVEITAQDTGDDEARRISRSLAKQIAIALDWSVLPDDD